MCVFTFPIFFILVIFLHININCKQIKVSIYHQYLIYIFLYEFISFNLYRISSFDICLDAYQFVFCALQVWFTRTQMFFPTWDWYFFITMLDHCVFSLCPRLMKRPIVHKEYALLHVRDAWWIVRCNEGNTPDAARRQEILRVSTKKEGKIAGESDEKRTATRMLSFRWKIWRVTVVL